MVSSISSDKRRSLAPPPGPTAQPVRLSVSRYASLDEHSVVSSYHSLSTNDAASSIRRSPSPAPSSIIRSRESPAPEVPVRAPERDQTVSSTSLVDSTIPPPSQDGTDSQSVSGKSTRTTAVIGRLTNSLESVKRDLKAERIQHEETLRTLSVTKQRIDLLQAENNNLIHGRETDAQMLERRDQKIAELRGQLEIESRRREVAEASSRDVTARLDGTIQDSKREVAIARDARALAETQYATLRASFSSHKADLERIKKLIKEHNQVREEDANKIVMLEAVCDRQAAEMKRAEALVKAMTKTVEGYREQSSKMAKLQDEMEQVRDRMKWVVSLQKTRDTTTPPG